MHSRGLVEGARRVFCFGHTVIYGPITSDTVWEDMDSLLKQRWAHPLGGTIGIDGAIIDAGDGGHFDLVAGGFCYRAVSGGFCCP